MSVVLSGVPQNMTRHELLCNLNKLFAKSDDIGPYKIRDLSNYRSNKRQVALDFNSGYDAMYAQHLLDGKQYNLPNGDLKVLRAKVTNDPEILADRSKTRLASESSSSLEGDLHVSHMSDKQLRKANMKMDEQLKFIEKQKLLVMSENELLKQKQKLEKRINRAYKEEKKKKKRNALKKALLITSDSETKPTKKKPRTKESSSESESDDNKHKKRKKSKKAKRRLSTPTSSSSESEERSIKAKRDRSPSSHRSSRNEDRHRHESKGRSSRTVKLDSPPSRASSRLKYRPREPSARRRRSSSEERSTHYRRRLSGRSTDRHDRYYSDKVYRSAHHHIHSYSNDIVYTSGSYPSQRAIEYRPNASEANRAESRDRKRRESSTVKNKEEDEIRKWKEAERIRKQNQLKDYKYEAIKDIMFEIQKYFSELCVEYNLSNDERKVILKNLFEIVSKRMETVGEDDEEIPIVTVSNLVLLYRCKYSKTEDKDLIGEVVQKLVSSRTTEIPESANDPLFELDLDSILQELNLDSLTEDVKHKIKTEEGEDEEDVKITIKLSPISSKDDSESIPQTKRYQENEDATEPHMDETATSPTAYHPDLSQYFINVKVDHKRQNKFFITTKRLKRDLREYINKYRGYLSHSVFRHVIQLILEDRIEKIVVGQEVMRARELENFYRTFYPKSDDHEFIKQVIYDVYAGLYNEKESAAEANPGDNLQVKQENDDLETENVTTEIKQETTDNTISIVKAEPCNNIKAVKEEPVSTKMDISVKTNAPAVKVEEIEVVEPKVEVIDLSDSDQNDTPANIRTAQNVRKELHVDKIMSKTKTSRMKQSTRRKSAQTGRQVTKNSVKENDIICLSDTENDAIVVSDDESSIDFTSKLTSKTSFNSSHSQEYTVTKLENQNQPEVLSKEICSNNNTIDVTGEVDDNVSVDTLILDTEDFHSEPNVNELDTNDEKTIVTADLNNPNSSVEAAVRSKPDQDNAVKINEINANDGEKTSGNSNVAHANTTEYINKNYGDLNQDIFDEVNETVESISNYLASMDSK